MAHPTDETIRAAVDSLNIGFGKQGSVSIQTFMGMQAALGFLEHNPTPIAKVTLCKVPCKSVNYTVTFWDKTATIVPANTKVYSNVR